MSTIAIEKQHTLGLAGARERVKKIEAKLKERHGIAMTWQSDTRADIKATGVSGQVELSATSIAIHIKLGLLLRPLAGKIREGLQHSVDRVFAATYDRA